MKINLSKAGGLYDDVLEGEFAGPKIKHIFVYLKVFFGEMGKKNFLKGGLRTYFTIGLPIFFGEGMGAYPKGARSAKKTKNLYFNTPSP